MVSYHHVQYKIVIKTNPIWRKFSEGRTDEQMDRQTVDSDFTGRCPTNVERPIKLFKNFIFVLNKGCQTNLYGCWLKQDCYNFEFFVTLVNG